MRLTESKLRQIVREELVREHKRKLHEDEVSRERRQARRATRGAWRDELKATIDQCKETYRNSEKTRADRQTKRECIKQARDKAKRDLESMFADIDTEAARERLSQAEANAARAEAAALEVDEVAQSTPEELATIAANELAAEEEREGQAAASVDIPTRFVKIGSRGPEVEKLQEWLTVAGFEAEVDGKFGSETKRAVEAFQEQEGLKVDGKVGPNTWQALAGKQSGATNESALTRNTLRSLISRELRRL